MSKAKPLVVLTTTRAVIDALGGYRVVAALAQRTHPNVAFNWLSQHTFPANTHHLLTSELAARGYTAPPSLFRQTAKVTAA